MDKQITKKRITGSLPVKIAVFILMILCVGVGMAAGYSAIYAMSEGVYEMPFTQQLNDKFYWQTRNDHYNIYHLIANSDALYGAEGADRSIYRLIVDIGDSRIADYCQGRNLRVKIYMRNNQEVWSNYDPEESSGWDDAYVYAFDEKLTFYFEPSATSDSGVLGEDIRIVCYVNRELPCADEYYKIWQQENFLYSHAQHFPVAAGVAIFITLICFIFLMCSAGHRNEQQDGGVSFRNADNDPVDGNGTADSGSSVPDVSLVTEGNRIYPGVLQGIWLDVLLALLIGILVVITWFASNLVGSYSGLIKQFWINGIIVVVWAMLTAFFGTVFCMELAIRMKRGGMFKHTLIYAVLRLIGRCIRTFVRSVSAILCSFPVLVPSFAAFAVLSVCEFLGLMIWGSGELAVVWFFERLLLIAVISYFGLVRGKLQKAAKALAEGNLSYHVDTSKMILGYKEHGNYLNSIGEGIAKAVAERMKSEHLKTELISNVSHDLKTPLTSIINYSDLLGQVGTDPEKVKEYTEVLHRQSIRLKKLLDDLLEVSKASTGNLSTDPAPCDVKVLITQTTGEYEQRFAEKNLELIHQEPEEDVHIMADHRHLFRIFDNLLGNIYKYAQPGSRVYLNVEKEEKKVRIVFRNMSEYPLNVNGGELMERFVRGDKSRHKEGNGLGLSIAMSLAQLQDGSLQIITDGDLFKAVLEFPVHES